MLADSPAFSGFSVDDPGRRGRSTRRRWASGSPWSRAPGAACRLLPDEVANLVAGLTEGLARMAREPRDLDRHGSDAGARRLTELEQRLAGLEARAAAPGWRRAASAVTAWARGATGTGSLRGRRHRR